MISLLLRNFVFTILQPGMVAGFIPYLIIRHHWREGMRAFGTPLHYLAIFLFGIGFVVMISCILRFVTEGLGTLSPLDPTKRLVTGGLYRYSRNPMYVGVMLILVGEALFFRSIALSVYATAVFAAFQIFIVIHEEPRMRRVFGEEYDSYCKRVRRWI